MSTSEGGQLRKVRLLLWVLAVVLGFHLLAAPSLVAESSILNPQSSALDAPIVEAQTAEPNFPNTITFRLKARGFTAQRAALHYRLSGSPVTSEAQADLDGPTAELDLEVELDLSTHYIPPGAEVVYYWTLIAPSGEVADTPTKTFKLLDERHRWQSLTEREKRVSVHWYNGDAPFGELLLDTASSALDRLERDIGASLERPAEVWVYASQDDLLDALPQNLPEWVGGKAFPELSLVMAAVADDEYAESETKRIIPHEISHLVLYQATRNPYNGPPAWLDEGIAVYNEETRYAEEEIMLEEAAAYGQLVPLKALSGSFGADEETALLSYIQARSAVEFILTDSRYGPEKLARTIDQFREGVTYDEAFQAGLGVTVDELDQQWRDSLPYEVAPPGSVPPDPVESESPTGSRFDALVRPLIFFGLGLFAAFFLVGAVLTVVFLLRRRAA